ncbi:hypothetical protein JTE90_025344 [Oedothorax gibbosus]|uniref:Uncharacterized protein n=1 Tax=Oedothorax gibbosus TaxID=931172 RepID=A0AAV6V762_9ARAC|nr:hypothetical protein JTE90_025344 [Oedothorax gibbosus]
MTLQDSTSAEHHPVENYTKHENELSDAIKSLYDVKKEHNLEDEVMNIVHIRYKNIAKEIIQFLKNQNGLKWTEKGEIIYQDKVIPQSNIVLLVNDFLRKQKSAPVGRTPFLNALRELQFPTKFDVRKKLFQDNKIVKKTNHVCS